MANEKKKREERKAGIYLLVIGLCISILSGYILFVTTILPGYSGFRFDPSIFFLIGGVVLFIIGLGLLLDYYYKAREEKPSKPSKPSRWKQAKPIT